MRYKLIKLFPGSPENIGDIIPTNEIYSAIFFGKDEKIKDWPEYFELIKDPIFVTFDWVSIFENSTPIWRVDCDDFDIDCFRCDEVIMSDRFIYFSCEKSANEWIAENMPKFSKKQLNDAIDKVLHKTIHPAFINNFKTELGL